MSRTLKTTIVVASYPGDRYLALLLNRLQELGYPRPRVVDRGTFAENNNAGAREAETDYVLFLNSDTLPEPGFVEAMEEVLDTHPQCGVVGAKLYFLEDVVRRIAFRQRVYTLTAEAGQLQHVGIMFNKHMLPYELGFGIRPESRQVTERQVVAAVTGACLMVRRRQFLELGGFDEGFRNGWEDNDLCLRYAERELVRMYEPQAVVGHFFAGGSAHGRFDREEENYNRFVEKWLRSGRLQKILGEPNRIRLDIGCGDRKKDGYIGLDKYPGKEVSHIFDLDGLRYKEGRLPFTESSVEEIYCAHTLEYVVEPVPVLNEFWRLLKTWGRLELIVPHAQSWAAFASPLQKSRFVPETFSRYLNFNAHLDGTHAGDSEIRQIRPWYIESLECTPVPEGTADPFSVKREIRVLMQPYKD